MRWIALRDIAGIDDGKLRATLVATGKPINIPVSVIEARNGNMAGVKDWFYERVFNTINPIRQEATDGRPHQKAV